MGQAGARPPPPQAPRGGCPCTCLRGQVLLPQRKRDQGNNKHVPPPSPGHCLLFGDQVRLKTTLETSQQVVPRVPAFRTQMSGTLGPRHLARCEAGLQGQPGGPRCWRAQGKGTRGAVAHQARAGGRAGRARPSTPPLARTCTVSPRGLGRRPRWTPGASDHEGWHGCRGPSCSPPGPSANWDFQQGGQPWSPGPGSQEEEPWGVAGQGPLWPTPPPGPLETGQPELFTS